MIVGDSECVDNDGPKPVYARVCNELPCPTWKLGEWSAVCIFLYLANTFRIGVT